MKSVKNILLGLFTGISVVCAVLMVLVGYSDRLNPVSYPLLSWVGMTMPAFIIINQVLLFFWVIIKWRRAWIPVVALIACYGPIRTYIPLHSRSTLPEGSIKVISYNVCGYMGNKAYSQQECTDSIVDYLRREQPDIACLQEDQNNGQDAFGRLKQFFAYNDTIHISREGAGGAYNTLGIHTRYPIVKRERIYYPSDSNGSAAFFLLIDGDTVVVINNHLESFHLSPDERQGYKDVLKGNIGRDSASAETKHLIRKVSEANVKRAPQAEAVHQYVSAQQAIGHPVIVCGDFNDTPISYARRTIARGLKDCYVESGSGLGISFNQGGFFFRIDQMMCSNHFTPYNCEVVNTIDASDHYPVVCWLKKD